MSKLIFTTDLFQAKLQWFLFLVWIQILGPFCPLWSPQVSALPRLRLSNISFQTVVVCTDWLTDWLRYDCHSILYCMWKYFGAVFSGALCFYHPFKCTARYIYIALWNVQGMVFSTASTCGITSICFGHAPFQTLWQSHCKSVCFSDKSCFGLFCIVIRRC